MKEYELYINGKWQKGSADLKQDIINPADGNVVAKVCFANREDTIKTVEYAKEAFYNGSWSELTPSQRSDLLLKVADEIEKNKDEFAHIETLNQGKPLKEAIFDVEDSIHCFKYYAGLISKLNGLSYEVDDDVQTIMVREPMGVCAMIVPWNYPLSMAVWKLAPALAAGNTIILKPSEITPLSSIKLFEVFDKVGFPKGVVNLLMGDGKVVGDELSKNKDVDKVSFTGGGSTGRSIMQNASGNFKNISLELGGKSPNIIFKDADFDLAVDHALYGIFFNAGQVCAAGSRLLVEEDIYDEFIETLKEGAEKIVVGNGMDENTDMGPVVSNAHMNKILDYIQIGKKEGARLLTGGYRLTDEAHKDGYYIAPTIFVDTTPDMRIVREEIFGPVLAVLKFKGEDEAIKLANDSDYGLAAAVFTKDGAKALRVIKKLRAGITWINTYHSAFIEAPWGGYKQSGIGMELGLIGFEEYTEVKQININLNPCPTNWFK